MISFVLRPVTDRLNDLVSRLPRDSLLHELQEIIRGHAYLASRQRKSLQALLIIS